MSDRFQPISMEQLTNWIFDEYEQKRSIFGIPEAAFFVPGEADRFKVPNYDAVLETPFGVAAGPHTQMAQNIVVAWLVGARFLELKTIQTLDELDINKPCIDLEDEGYNVEWSQELKVHQSFDEYLRAWVLIHALHDKLGFPGDAPGMIFNMSVGYDLAGIQQPNVQWYLDVMSDASDYIAPYIDIVAERYPEVRSIDIPAQVSNTVTLSTMHGCPPDEIEAITTYLLEERGLHTSVKCNPTLLGADRVRRIVNDELGFTDVTVPDEAFGHDLEYVDAVPMFHNLRRIARREGLTFGLKLSNTLEVENHRPTFPDDEMMYLSGRALHAVTVNLAMRLSEEFHGDLLLSFAGGADAFNVSDLLRSGMATITVCSDLLKTGGYLRLPQYLEELNTSLDEAEATDLADFIGRTAVVQDDFSSFPQKLAGAMLAGSGLAFGTEDAEDLAGHLKGLAGSKYPEAVRSWAVDRGAPDDDADVLASIAMRTLARVNLQSYAATVRNDWRYLKQSFRTHRSKTDRKLGLFDCIEAPCVDECPIDQDVPAYMRAVREGRFDDAVEITRRDNPVSGILGRVCDHLCETTCIRTHLDQPLAIRDMKRFIMSHEQWPRLPVRSEPLTSKVAVIGAGPAGIAAARDLAAAGISVTIFEAHPYAGGMVGGAIPEYRLPQHEIDKDMAVLEELGVEIRYNQTAGEDFTLEDLRSEGFTRVFVAVGAQLPKYLGFEGEDADGVVDALRFLRSVREHRPIPIGSRVGVVGAGDTAMDCARSAWRVGADEVTIIYRRSIDQMPADPEEIHGCVEEGVRIEEHASPASLHVEDGVLKGLVVTKTEFRGDRDSSGRKIPYDVPDSEYEIALDTLILAISQHSMLGFFGDDVPELTSRGYIAVDPESLESSIAGVYAGGDVAADGPSSIVKAAADGKAAAASIIAAEGGPVPNGAAPMPTTDDLPSLIMRRARREYRVPTRFTPLTVRNNFNETALVFTAEEAQQEASRCVDCDTICSLCVGVCPNLALMTYQMEAFSADLPVYEVADGGLTERGSVAYRVDQPHQIAVLTDFCNECGNCVTACPTSGRPYEDKPRLYLDRDEFDAEADNAFLVEQTTDAVVVLGRFASETHRLSVNGSIDYEGPDVSATFGEDFTVRSAQPGAGAEPGAEVSLEPAATMYVVWSGLAESMPEVPTVTDSGTFVPAPEL
ncbi:MAG: FAD-dependent oxidoreductase [Acidimicrobiia bacterium]|nr:FAD-dependent oxidoreductase [Acidimicrobiia bacterium]